MGRTCTICTHPEREAIEAALIGQRPYRDIALQYGVGVMALHRHRKHLSERVLKAKEAKEQLSASRLLRDLSALQGKALSVLAQAERAGDLRTALLAVGQARGCIEAAAKILETSELEERIERLERAMEGQDD